MTSPTDRYIAATLSGVPESSRTDVERELRASIADAVDARTEQGEPVESAERGVLTDLGDPARLSASYAERPLYLIGPAHFLPWRRTLITLISVIPPLVAVINFLIRSALAPEPSSIADALADAIVLGLGVALQVAFWVTVGFAVLERVPTGRVFGSWTPDALPDPSARQSRTDAVGVLIFAGLMIAALVWQQFATVAVTADGPVEAPVLAPSLWTLWLPVLIVVLVGQIAVAVLRLRQASPTRALDVVKLVFDLAFPLVVLYLAAQDMLVNREFLAAFDAPVDDTAAVVDAFVIIGSAIVIVFILIDFAVKALRLRRGHATA
ncbi:permease prefix domain 1-containing protein [Herbiconiux sp. L3-i23]|uniref:permease prefix domain 1-containing protein n=1 Tax=Herbiconiux sp. L3-i23 TaxID=2905871 RepID=UPI0020576ED4|nr:permease prefix domain 1-containing protein [Herbiconiux sp. L3-i23]BDI23268.1 hypothetical protein L3i23_20440 [Herbiconiux sp. L3-i23]